MRKNSDSGKAKKAILYARYSPRPNAKDSKSSDIQLYLCKRYAEIYHFPVDGAYHDDAKSGDDTTRPEFRKAIDHACRVKGVLIVYKLDRMARSLKIAINTLEKLQKAGADFASVTERFDTTEPHGKLFFQIFAALAEFVRSDISARTSEMVRGHMARGRTVGGIPPFGWQWDITSPILTGHKKHSRMIKHPVEQGVLARIYMLHHQGASLYRICKRLNTADITCRGGKWHHETVKRCLIRAGLVKGK